MYKSILGVSLTCGLLLSSLNGAALAGQRQTVRTGPYGNTFTTNRSWGNNQQQTVRTGPYGNTFTTNRSWGNNQQQTVRTGPGGNSFTTNRSW